MREYTLSSWMGTYVRSPNMREGGMKEKGSKDRRRMGYTAGSGGEVLGRSRGQTRGTNRDKVLRVLSVAKQP